MPFGLLHIIGMITCFGTSRTAETLDLSSRAYHKYTQTNSLRLPMATTSYGYAQAFRDIDNIKHHSIRIRNR